MLTTEHTTTKDVIDFANRFFKGKMDSIVIRSKIECNQWANREKFLAGFVEQHNAELSKLSQLVPATFFCVDKQFTAHIRRFVILSISSDNPRVGLSGIIYSSVSDKFNTPAEWELNGEVVGRKKETFNLSIP